MSSPRTHLGAFLTIIWIGLVSFLAFRDTSVLSEMHPNEWGDFLAGCFAPLAFLWLVLGYLQQGDELRLSTDALRLQAEELKNSVEQQRELVEVSRQQVESEREALVYERMLREELSIPKFSVLGPGGAFGGDGVSKYNISISNIGHDATAFSAKVNFLNEGWRDLMSYPLFGKGTHHLSTIERPKPLEEGNSVLTITCIDGLGRPLEKSYKITRDSDHPHASLLFKELRIS